MYPPPTGRGRDQRFRGAQYLLGQGLWNYEHGVTRPFVAPGQSVELDLRFGDDETVNARFMLALWAWLTYGGLGARTRRGFGQLRCTHVTGDDLPGGWTARHLTAPATTHDWKGLAECALPADLPGRTILLAEPVRVRLTAYLDYRTQRWPHTANPHLFIHHRTALGTKPVGTRWPGFVLGTAARDIRTDRILDEVRATDGDLRRICALFGMSVKAAARYTTVLDHPGMTGK